MEDPMGAVGGIASVAVIGWIIRIFVTNRRSLKMAQMQLELQNRLIDKFDTADAKCIPSLQKLPDPTVVWWRARQQARIRQVELATLPIQYAERLALILGAVG